MAKNTQTSRPTGVYAALASPRRQVPGEIDSAFLLDYLDTIAGFGVDGLVLFGATGEFIHFDMEERVKAFALAIRRSRIPVLVNVSHSTLAGATYLAENAMNAGAAGLMLLPAYFYKYSDHQMAAFYFEFAAGIAGRCPIYIYHLPDFTARIPAEIIERLLRSGAFAGIKDSSGDGQLMEHLLQLRRELPFTLMAGNESLYLRARLSGADGIVSGLAAALPDLMVATDRAIRSGDIAKAERLNAHIEKFIECISQFPATVGIKQAAVVRGWKLNHTAFPFDERTSCELTKFRRWFENWLPGVLADCRYSTAARA